MMWLTILLWIAGIALVAVAIVVCLIIYFVALITADNGTDDDPWGDPSVCPRQTGTYPTGVDVRYPEPADQQHDSDSIPKLDKRWPGLVKPKRRAF